MFLHQSTNSLYRLKDDLQLRGRKLVDLTSGNVSEHGIIYPQELLERIFLAATRAVAVYTPDSLGRRSAREAISRFYSDRGVVIPAEQILLTPGTSIAYWYCFKLLAEEGEEILCPRPSYPLFEYIAKISGVRMVPYRMVESSAWSIDLEFLEACLSTRTRAIVLISPHNPTGHVASEKEVRGLAEIARRHNLAIISDEVFSEFLFEGGSLPRPAATEAPLVLTLNGFSKLFALPGVKLGWIAVSGQEEKMQTALRALELISDTFLPVNEIVQAAVPELLENGKSFLENYRSTIRDRWSCARQILSGSEEISFVPPDGGFYVTLQLRNLDEEEAALRLLREGGLLTHPGYFYDIDPSHLVVSFVQTPELIKSAFPEMLRLLSVESM